MPPLHRSILVIPFLVVALVAGCGRKGPLYLPPPPPASSVPVEQGSAKPVEAEPKQAPSDPRP